MLLAEIRDLIRAEANLQGLNEYSTLIDSILNQELQQMTGKSKYEELRDTTTLTSTEDGTSTFDLPADFQLFASAIFYREGETSGYELSQGVKFEWEVKANGCPLYYVRYGQKLVAYPYTNFFNGDFITLGYYKKPFLQLDTDVFLVESLEKAVIQATMGRMLRMVDTKRAQMATADADKAWMESRAQNAAN